MGNSKKRKALEMMRLQLDKNHHDVGMSSSDKVFSQDVMKRKRVANVGSVVTKYNITLTD